MRMLSEETLQEIENFGIQVDRLKKKEIPEEKFKRFRLQNGVYGQRQTGVQMVRVRIPSGRLNAEKLRALADVAERFSTGKGHVTTRQDVQFHFVKLGDIVPVLYRLAESGLTTREACGNTVRNVTACHRAGICPTELFDVTPYANAVADHLLRNPINQDLPRKFKISFSGCQSECGLATMHDLGLIAAKREVDGAVEYGFRVFVGGGLGASPKLAKLYAEFLPMDALLPTCEAILKLFDDHGDRKVRSKARMKFVLEKWGIEAFKEKVVENLADLQASGVSYPDLAPPRPNPIRPVLPERSPERSAEDVPSDYARWVRTNLIPQAEEGFCAVQIRLIVGDITAAQLSGLAEISEQFSSDQVRATHQQNFILHKVRRSDLPALYAKLMQYDLAEAGAEQVTDVIACPGTDSCQLGLTSSMGMGEALVSTFAKELPEYEDLTGLRIRISGCPNSCAQHHIAGIGLHGVAKKVNGKLVPHYQLHLGGGVSATHSAIGKAKLKIPAKNVPGAVLEMIKIFRENRAEHEAFNPFVERYGREALCTQIEKFTKLPSLDLSPESYHDYKSDQDFDLEDLGPGECAGTMIDLIENYLRRANTALSKAHLSTLRQQHSEAVAQVQEGMMDACRALLVPFGIDSPHEDEILKNFQHKVVEQGIVSERFEAFTEDLGKWAPVNSELVTAYLTDARAFVQECQEAYDQMDANLKLRKKEEEPVAAKSDLLLDLSGVACPMNFVKTKLQLEEMDAGQILHVILDGGEPIRNVPRSVQSEGHKVVEVSPRPDGRHNLVIEKVGA
jgi:sulfite reductase (ferredoxin)